MAKKPCCICKNMVGFLDRTELADGVICDDCWSVVRAANPGMKNAYLFPVEQVKEAYYRERPCANSNHTHDNTPPTTFYSEPTQLVTYQPAENSNSEISIWEKMKIIGSILTVILGIAVICMSSTSSGKMFFADFLASINPEDNEYVHMVQNLRPIDGGRSYEQAFASSFENNEWSYFKDGDTRYVEVKSYADDSDDCMVTQFVLTPTGENGQFMIEICSMELPDGELNKFEMITALSFVFGEEVQSEILRNLLQ